MTAIKIGTCNIGGATWSIEINNEYCKQNKVIFSFDTAKQVISLRDTYKGGKNTLFYRNIMANFWNAILSELFNHTLEYRKLNYSKFITPYSSLINQITETLTSEPGQWDGSFNIGGKTYSVTTYEGDDLDCYGYCNPNEYNIKLKVGDKEGPYSDSFIHQTLWHEILHAIAFELGRYDHIINSEKFVNPLSIFISEIVGTLNIKFPDE